MGGIKNLILFLIFVTIISFSSLIIYNEIHEFSFYAYLIVFAIGILDSANETSL
jgi:hypothetical protein